jgi:MOSC domain-containing protein YiiM
MTPPLAIVSVNVGLPRAVTYRGKKVLTGIYKEPVEGRIAVGHTNLAGDRQADLKVHGGVDKAVYAYPSEHYAYWREQLPEMDLPWGMFGENLSTRGLLEDSVHVGDRFRFGSAELEVTQPRMPCFKLGVKFGTQRMVKRFQQSGRNGFYFRVLREGDVAAGDPIEVLERDEHGVSIARIARLYTEQHADWEELRTVSTLPRLSARWRAHFEKRLAEYEPQP